MPWPTRSWPEGRPGWLADLEPFLAEAFDPGGPLGTTYAVVLVHHGRLVLERYGGAIEHWDATSEPVAAETRLLSWSMAKSMLHAALGVLVGRGRLDVDAPAPVPAWRSEGDPRRLITVEHLLSMRDGLDFVEDYEDDRISDVIHMLFGAGQDDVAAYATARPPAAPPGAHFNYSSGTSNILSWILGGLTGGGEAVVGFLEDDLFGPIGATTATPSLDGAGTWIASSYVHATAQDFARFGYLYLRDGEWDGCRILPPGWVDHGRRPRSVDPEGLGYGAHWWVVGDDHGSFAATGYEGQQIVVCPGLDAVLVRLGKTPAARYPDLRRWRARVLATVADATSAAGTSDRRDAR